MVGLINTKMLGGKIKNEKQNYHHHWFYSCNNVFTFSSLLLSMMDLIVDVLLEVFSIVLMGFICFTIYVNGKIFLIKIGIIDKEQDDESIKD